MVVEGLTELSQLGVDILIPRGLITLNHIVLALIIKLLNKPSILEVKHLKVSLNLDHFIDPNLVE